MQKFGLLSTALKNAGSDDAMLEWKIMVPIGRAAQGAENRNSV